MFGSQFIQVQSIKEKYESLIQEFHKLKKGIELADTTNLSDSSKDSLSKLFEDITTKQNDIQEKLTTLDSQYNSLESLKKSFENLKESFENLDKHKNLISIDTNELNDAYYSLLEILNDQMTKKSNTVNNLYEWLIKLRHGSDSEINIKIEALPVTFKMQRGHRENLILVSKLPNKKYFNNLFERNRYLNDFQKALPLVSEINETIREKLKPFVEKKLSPEQPLIKETLTQLNNVEITDIRNSDIRNALKKIKSILENAVGNLSTLNNLDFLNNLKSDEDLSTAIINICSSIKFDSKSHNLLTGERKHTDSISQFENLVKKSLKLLSPQQAEEIKQCQNQIKEFQLQEREVVERDKRGQEALHELMREVSSAPSYSKSRRERKEEQEEQERQKIKDKNEETIKKHIASIDLLRRKISSKYSDTKLNLKQLKRVNLFFEKFKNNKPNSDDFVSTRNYIAKLDAWEKTFSVLLVDSTENLFEKQFSDASSIVMGVYSKISSTGEETEQLRDELFKNQLSNADLETKKLREAKLKADLEDKKRLEKEAEKKLKEILEEENKQRTLIDTFEDEEATTEKIIDELRKKEVEAKEKLFERQTDQEDKTYELQTEHDPKVRKVIGDLSKIENEIARLQYLENALLATAKAEKEAEEQARLAAEKAEEEARLAVEKAEETIREAEAKLVEAKEKAAEEARLKAEAAEKAKEEEAILKAEAEEKAAEEARLKAEAEEKAKEEEARLKAEAAEKAAEQARRKAEAAEKAKEKIEIRSDAKKLIAIFQKALIELDDTPTELQQDNFESFIKESKIRLNRNIELLKKIDERPNPKNTIAILKKGNNFLAAMLESKTAAFDAWNKFLTYKKKANINIEEHTKSQEELVKQFNEIITGVYVKPEQAQPLFDNFKNDILNEIHQLDNKIQERKIAQQKLKEEQIARDAEAERLRQEEAKKLRDEKLKRKQEKAQAKEEAEKLRQEAEAKRQEEAEKLRQEKVRERQEAKAKRREEKEEKRLEIERLRQEENRLRQEQELKHQEKLETERKLEEAHALSQEFNSGILSRIYEKTKEDIMWIPLLNLENSIEENEISEKILVDARNLITNLQPYIDNQTQRETQERALEKEFRKDNEYRDKQSELVKLDNELFENPVSLSQLIENNKKYLDKIDKTKVYFNKKSLDANIAATNKKIIAMEKKININKFKDDMSKLRNSLSSERSKIIRLINQLSSTGQAEKIIFYLKSYAKYLEIHANKIKNIVDTINISPLSKDANQDAIDAKEQQITDMPETLEHYLEYQKDIQRKRDESKDKQIEFTTNFVKEFYEKLSDTKHTSSVAAAKDNPQLTNELTSVFDKVSPELSKNIFDKKPDETINRTILNKMNQDEMFMGTFVKNLNQFQSKLGMAELKTADDLINFKKLIKKEINEGIKRGFDNSHKAFKDLQTSYDLVKERMKPKNAILPNFLANLFGVEKRLPLNERSVKDIESLCFHTSGTLQSDYDVYREFANSRQAHQQTTYGRFYENGFNESRTPVKDNVVNDTQLTATQYFNSLQIEIYKAKACKQECKDPKSDLYAELEQIINKANKISKLNLNETRVIIVDKDLRSSNKHGKPIVDYVSTDEAKKYTSISGKGEHEIYVPIGTYIFQLKKRLSEIAKSLNLTGDKVLAIVSQIKQAEFEKSKTNRKEILRQKK